MDCCNQKEETAGFAQLDPILKKYAEAPGSLITILQKTQDAYGYLPGDALRHISNQTGIALSKIYGVATFYTQFRLKPIGKNLLLLCMGTACHVNGAANIREAVSEKLGITDGGTTDDGLFTLNIVACLGCCSLAPVMMVRTQGGEDVYGNLTKASVVKILDEIAAGQKGVDEPEASDPALVNKEPGANKEVNA